MKQTTIKTISPDLPPELLGNMKVYTIHTSDGPWLVKAPNVVMALDMVEDKISTILHTDGRTITILNKTIEVEGGDNE